jgi:hypothetical protein
VHPYLILSRYSPSTSSLHSFPCPLPRRNPPQPCSTLSPRSPSSRDSSTRYFSLRREPSLSYATLIARFVSRMASAPSTCRGRDGSRSGPSCFCRNSCCIRQVGLRHARKQRDEQTHRCMTQARGGRLLSKERERAEAGAARVDLLPRPDQRSTSSQDPLESNTYCYPPCHAKELDPRATESRGSRCRQRRGLAMGDRVSEIRKASASAISTQKHKHSPIQYPRHGIFSRSHSRSPPPSLCGTPACSRRPA